MSFINYVAKEINCKIVYYGPGLSGKTTNIQFIHDQTQTAHRGNLVTLSTENERTLFFDFLPLSNREKPPVRKTADDPEREEISLDTLVPTNPNKPYDMHEVILKVVDEGDFFEIQAKHAGNIITGFGRINGQTVGVVANQPMVLAG